MVYFSPEIKGPRIEEARCEWEIYVDLAKRVKPEESDLASSIVNESILTPSNKTQKSHPQLKSSYIILYEATPRPHLKVSF